ncbi:MAG: plastocyanin/azurin family copper-binding protein [Solirubrobacterales bacterium]
MTKKLLIALATLALAAFALAACGDDESTTAAEGTTEDETTAEDTAGGGGGGTIAVAAEEDGSFAFTETQLTTSAGPNTIEFSNPSDVPHNVFIEDDTGEVLAETETVTGSDTTASADLEAGTYTFYCDIPGHREGGMEGTLTVE